MSSNKDLYIFKLKDNLYFDIFSEDTFKEKHDSIKKYELLKKIEFNSKMVKPKNFLTYLTDVLFLNLIKKNNSKTFQYCIMINKIEQQLSQIENTLIFFTNEDNFNNISDFSNNNINTKIDKIIFELDLLNSSINSEKNNEDKLKKLFLNFLNDELIITKNNEDKLTSKEIKDLFIQNNDLSYTYKTKKDQITTMLNTTINSWIYENKLNSEVNKTNKYYIKTIFGINFNNHEIL